MKFYQRAGIFSIILFCAVTLLPVAASASELVGYWKFNESSGDAVDSSGNLPNLTNNNVTYGAGQYGNAAYFNGSTAFFVGTGPDLNGQSFTFSAWLWREAGGGQEIYFSQGSGDGNHNNLHLRVYDDGLMRFGFLNNDLDAPSGTFVMGQWNHVVLTYDAATNARKIYLNGGEAKASDSSISDFIGNTALNIGRWIRNGGDQYWTGRIDDLKIYNRALTLEEVDDLAEGGQVRGFLVSRHSTLLIMPQVFRSPRISPPHSVPILSPLQPVSSSSIKPRTIHSWNLLLCLVPKSQSRARKSPLIRV